MSVDGFALTVEGSVQAALVGLLLGSDEEADIFFSHLENSDLNEDIVPRTTRRCSGYYIRKLSHLRLQVQPLGWHQRATVRRCFLAISGSREPPRPYRRRLATAFPTVGGVAPGVIPGIDWSDHWSFVKHGFQALMITDTAYFRYPHYHKPTDTPDKIDAEKLARVVKGVERVIRDAAK